MSETEKNESQKTVVAFITGLLIGGLLVWVFSSTPEEKKNPTEENTTTEQTNKTAEIMSGKVSLEASNAIGNGSIEVVDQVAGNSVILKSTQFPTKKGWLVVREIRDGVGIGALGAARYSLDDGLIPTSVDVVKPTLTGKNYEVVFFTDEGDKGFSLAEDKLIESISAKFKVN